jgi:hypothetical protein
MPLCFRLLIFAAGITPSQRLGRLQDFSNAPKQFIRSKWFAKEVWICGGDTLEPDHLSAHIAGNKKHLEIRLALEQVCCKFNSTSDRKRHVNKQQVDLFTMVLIEFLGVVIVAAAPDFETLLFQNPTHGLNVYWLIIDYQDCSRIAEHLYSANGILEQSYAIALPVLAQWWIPDIRSTLC